MNNFKRTDEYLKNFTREKVLKLLVDKNNPLIIDVGANMGQSIEEFFSIWPSGSVIAFEPQNECVKHLNSIKQKLNDQNLEIIEAALGSEDLHEGRKFFSHNIESGVTGHTSGLSGFNKLNLDSKDSINLMNMDPLSDEYAAYTSGLNIERQVPCFRLDSFLSKTNLKKIDLLKIDTQGFEPEVLEGAGEYLKSTKVVLTELMIYDLYERKLTFSDIEKYLLPAGFELFDISHISKNPANGRTDWVDLIYVNKNM
jgi:FkbM family methyltransferase